MKGERRKEKGERRKEKGERRRKETNCFEINEFDNNVL